MLLETFELSDEYVRAALLHGCELFHLGRHLFLSFSPFRVGTQPRHLVLQFLYVKVTEVGLQVLGVFHNARNDFFPHLFLYLFDFEAQDACSLQVAQFGSVARRGF